MIPITKPTLPLFDDLKEEIKEIFSTGMITNNRLVKDFETKLQNYLGVKHAVAVSSCTSGLMLVLKALDIKGEVIIPSFTFSASGHAIMWNNLTPKFVEIDKKTYNVSIDSIREAITENTSAILAIHLFGCPANVDELQKIAKENNLKLIFDAAHAMGAKVNERFIGTYGDAEVFSCSPTKLLITGEGGIVTTNDDELARKIRIGRSYGDPGNYDCEFPGLNARMEEFNALLGIKSLDMLEANIRKRKKLVEVYKEKLGEMRGISFQEVHEGYRSTFKDFSILIDQKFFKLNRDQLEIELQKEGVQTKKYFYPPLHEQRAYQQFKSKYHDKLPITKAISENILSLPLYSHMSQEEVEEICRKVKSIHQKN